MSKKKDGILIASISSGSFGHVDVFAKEISHLFVIKKISKKETSEDEFLSEVSLLKKVSNSNQNLKYFPLYQNSWEDKRYFYLQMSYIPGMNLTDFYSRIENEEVFLSANEYQEMFIKMTQRLSEIHQIGLLHLDIKPGNFVRDHEGNIYLVDFGFSLEKKVAIKNLEEFGTRHYKAPEIYNKKGKTEKTDIFALGCTFYYFIFRKNFFDFDKEGRKKISKIRIDFSDSTKNENGERKRSNLKDFLIQEKTIEGNFNSPESSSKTLNNLLISMVSNDIEKRPTANSVLETLEKISWEKVFPEKTEKKKMKK